jgi:LPS-assembly lipoprotein
VRAAANRLPVDARRRRLVGALALAGALAGCGFQLRGRAALPFDTLYVSGLDYSPFTGQLKRAIETGSDTKLADTEGAAQAVLELQNESQERAILAVSGGGRVREFQLRYRVNFRVHDGKGRDWLPTSEVLLRRDLTYDDTQILAKEAEALMLFKDMQSDAVQQVLRRIQSIRPASAVETAG